MSDGRSALMEWRTTILASELRWAARLVALVLSTHMDSNGASCFPSVETIARESGLGRRSVQRALDELEAASLLERKRGGGRGKSSRYRAKGVRGTPFSRERVSLTTVKGVRMTPEDAQEGVKNLLTRADARENETRAPKARTRKRKNDPWEGEDLSVYDRA